MVELRLESDLGAFLSCHSGARKDMAGEGSGGEGQSWDSLPKPGEGRGGAAMGQPA